MKAYWDYLIDLLKHKWWVFVECWRLGIPWLGVIHDWTKLHPAEFPHAAKRYMGTEAQKKAAKEPYRKAWLHHQHHNKHHWIFWVVYVPIPGYEWEGGWGCIPIPHRYRLEMLADWRASSKRFGKPELEWYTEQQNRILLHPDTRDWIEEQLEFQLVQ